MIAPSLPANEAERLLALERYETVDTMPEASFDRVVNLAARLLEVPIALITLMERDRQWFKACFGTDLRENTRELSFCGHTILLDAPMVVPDALLDERFRDNPVVTGLGIRFYAGLPLRTSDGFNIGTLCVYDFAPHPEGLSDQALQTLTDLAAVVMDNFEARRVAKRAASAEAEIRQLHEAQKRFVSDVSHELRAPLTGIRGNLQLLRRYPDMSSAESRTALEETAREAERLTRLIANLLALARGEGLEPRSERLKLHEVIREAFNDARHLSGDTTVVELRQLDAVNFTGDSDGLKQLAIILLDNAIKYTPAGGRISLELRDLGAEVELRVSDTGIGIPTDRLERVFDRFYRTAASRARDPGGSGLGLSIARQIVEAHGGRIRLENAPQHGTTAVVNLPLVGMAVPV